MSDTDPVVELRREQLHRIFLTASQCSCTCGAAFIGWKDKPVDPVVDAITKALNTPSVFDDLLAPRNRPRQQHRWHNARRTR